MDCEYGLVKFVTYKSMLCLSAQPQGADEASLRLWFSTKSCGCYSAETYVHVNSPNLILKLNLTSMRNMYIKMCVVLNEDHNGVA